MEIKSASGYRPEKTALSSSRTDRKPKGSQSQPAPKLDTYQSAKTMPFGSQMQTIIWISASFRWLWNPKTLRQSFSRLQGIRFIPHHTMHKRYARHPYAISIPFCP